MNFDKLANIISENITPTVVASEEMEGARGRAPNPEIEKLVAQGMPYWKARAMVKKGLAGAPATPAAAAPVSSKGLTAASAKTQAAVDDFVSANPEASVDDVIEHLKNLNAGPLAIKTAYVVDPKEVVKMVAVSKGEEPAAEPTFDPESEKKAKFERLRKFMSMPRAEREKFLAARKKAAVVEPEEPDEEEEEEEDSYVKYYLDQMKEPEEEPEFDAGQD